MARMRLRAENNRLKIEHSIIEGVREMLERLLRDYPEEVIRSVVPGRISKVRDARGTLKVHITVPVMNGWKAIALSSGSRQELFISTTLGEQELLAALTRAATGSRKGESSAAGGD